MNEKKIFKRLVLTILACLLSFGCFVWIIDPFYQYHAPWFHIPIVLDTAVYQTAGAARNLAYDSAIIGTSMTENIHTSWLDEALGWNTMKLSYSGARSNDLQAIFEQVSNKDGELKNVILDVNDYQFTSESWTSYVERPHYLYDEKLYNDHQYLLNKDIFTTSIRRIIDRVMGVQDNIDTAYTWEEAELFSKEIAQAACVNTREQLVLEKSAQYGEENLYYVNGELSADIDEKMTICQENLNNILPFIEAHPKTQFYVLVPAYSMLYWEQKVLNNTLEDTLAIYAHVFEQFLQYDNVSVYYFQYEPEIITDLDNYRDTAHHKPEYNRYMIDCMINGEKELTLENYREKLEEMYKFAKEYPYVAMWE